ncbi:hypothetical protein EVAR_65233_1 [Eumeta japonica]|uniref:Uncharacterized protein n=1 Tax=Eumeta variegata TaxID=151549 RepID=A0A4C1ZIX7_EUMVA|nr:hypothetical protein EVAR_65233_1 [Eumeta japonica]
MCFEYVRAYGARPVTPGQVPDEKVTTKHESLPLRNESQKALCRLKMEMQARRRRVRQILNLRIASFAGNSEWQNPVL